MAITRVRLGVWTFDKMRELEYTRRLAVCDLPYSASLAVEYRVTVSRTPDGGGTITCKLVESGRAAALPEDEGDPGCGVCGAYGPAGVICRISKAAGKLCCRWSEKAAREAPSPTERHCRTCAAYESAKSFCVLNPMRVCRTPDDSCLQWLSSTEAEDQTGE